MSSIVTDHGILHYESIGRGRPIILLHGWINSWDVWRDSMIALANRGTNRVYALDFWGFGDSAKQTVHTAFQVNSYVQMVYEFMEALGIQSAPVFGHSMGGTVALQFALTYPDRIKKFAVVGSPIQGSSLNPFLKLAGQGWIAELVWRYPVLRSTIMWVLLQGDSDRVRNMIFRDVKRTSLDSFFRSINDLRRTDLREQLKTLTVPVLGIYGVNDNIVSPKNARILTQGTQMATVKMMQRSRHFPMTDEPQEFLQTLDNFLNENHEVASAMKTGNP
ncbi:MAG: alpha/beta hydrolase [Chloroflexi bacterium]|nr:alpha/beta hydrolase [Chloroflexota bacterium]MBP8054851.1 alpha/beta hydrolase [Chloroflexota bacterium]